MDIFRTKKINDIPRIFLYIKKISNLVVRNDNFPAKARKLSIFPTSLDIFDIRQDYILSIYIKS